MSDPHANVARPASLAERLGTGPQRFLTILAVVGLVLSLIGLLVRPEHFFFSYLTAYATCLTLVLGMMFFVMLHYVADAGWSTVVRRPAEQLLAALPMMAGLLLPVLVGMPWLYHWLGADDELARAKAPFLNIPFFLVRAAFYFAVWLLLGRLFRGGSLRQDQTGDPQITLRLRKWSAPGLILYALTLTFASIDWLMTLDYHWFSTIFGTYVWSGSTVSSLALLTILAVVLRRGPLRDKLPIGRLHDLGKWVFAFAIFWAYIAFSQYFLIWYANIPEETGWMIHRWTGETGTATWWAVAMLLPGCLFIVPFGVLMSANAKRRADVLVPVCVIILIGHYLDSYWLVMPAAYPLGPNYSMIWVDLGTLALVVGLAGSVVLRAMRQSPWYPVRDPRLPEAVADEEGHTTVGQGDSTVHGPAASGPTMETTHD